MIKMTTMKEYIKPEMDIIVSHAPTNTNYELYLNTGFTSVTSFNSL